MFFFGRLSQYVHGRLNAIQGIPCSSVYCRPLPCLSSMGGGDMYPMRGVNGKPLLLHAEPKLATGSRETSHVDDVGKGHDFALRAGKTGGCEAELLKFDLDLIEGR